MAETKLFQLPNEIGRFRFEVERHVLGRSINGVEVRNDFVALSLSGGGFIRFQVDGPNIMVSVPDVPPCPTLDIVEEGPVQ